MLNGRFPGTVVSQLFADVVVWLRCFKSGGGVIIPSCWAFVASWKMAVAATALRGSVRVAAVSGEALLDVGTHGGSQLLGFGCVHRRRRLRQPPYKYYRLHLQEVPQQLRPTLTQKTLRVELDAVDGVFFVSEAHDFERVVFVLGPGGDFEVVGDGVFGDDEAVVAGCGEGVREVFEDALAVVVDVGGFALLQADGADDFGSVDIG